MSKVINKKLHPYYKIGINGWIGEEVDDNDYILCPICGEVLGMNYCDYASEQGCNDKCPKCSQELDYSEIYDFEDTCYFEQLLEIKDQRISDLEAKLAESEKENRDLEDDHNKLIEQYNEQYNDLCKEINVHSSARERFVKKVEELQQQLTEKQSKIQELNDMYEDLLCAKVNEHELKQAKEDVKMLDERRLCLFSLLYETLEKQGCENITSTIEQMTNLHLNKCSHWYKNNRVCDELKQQLAEKEKKIQELSYKLNEKQKSDSGRGWKLENGKIIYFCNYLSDYKCERSLEDVVKDLNQMTKESDTAWEIRTLYQGLKNENQGKISFAIDELVKVKNFVNYRHFDFVPDGLIERFEVEKKINNQIEELKKENK